MLVCVYAYELQMFLVFLVPVCFVCNVLLVALGLVDAVLC